MESDCMEYEGDQRHIEILEKQLGFRDSNKAVVSPGCKTQHGPLDGPDACDPKSFKSRCMRVAFVALDRPEI
eukprot:12234426-Karenia_brevis.AAC.1